MRRCLALAALAAASSCTTGAPAPARTGPPPRGGPVVTDRSDILPAGAYFVSYIYSSCPDCERPKGAAVVGVYATAEAAVRAAADVPSAGLGYPLLLHTEELGRKIDGRPGVVVIAALLSRADGPSPIPGAHVVKLPGRDQMEDPAEHGDTENDLRLVVRIDAGGPAPAYDPNQVTHDEDNEDGDDGEPNLGEAQPICSVPAGAAFVTQVDKLDWYRFARVRCPDGRTGLVPWKRTLVAASILPRPDGGYRLVQVVGASCDSPSYEEWHYGPSGRRKALPFEQALCRG